MTRPPWDPDPLYFGPSSDYIEGYDAGFDDAERLHPPVPLLGATAFGLGIVLGMFLALVLMYAAAATPRSGQTTAPIDVSRVLSAGQSTGPLVALSEPPCG